MPVASAVAAAATTAAGIAAAAIAAAGLSSTFAWLLVRLPHLLLLHPMGGEVRLALWRRRDRLHQQWLVHRLRKIPRLLGLR